MFQAADQLQRMEIAVECSDALADILGEIADTFQIGGDAQRADDLAQIDRHRLARGDGQHGALFDRALQLVDLGVGGDDALAPSATSRRISASTDSTICRSARPPISATRRVELLQVVVESLGGVFKSHLIFLPRICASAEAAGDVILGAAIGRRREDLVGLDRTRSTRRDT